jgi:hypothetical protein
MADHGLINLPISKLFCNYLAMKCVFSLSGMANSKTGNGGNNIPFPTPAYRAHRQLS